MEEGSPLRVYTDRMATALQEKLGMQCEVGMRYGNPSIKSKLHTLKEAGCENIIILPLYPQYAAATTASTGQ